HDRSSGMHLFPFFEAALAEGHLERLEGGGYLRFGQERTQVRRLEEFQELVLTVRRAKDPCVAAGVGEGGLQPAPTREVLVEVVEWNEAPCAAKLSGRHGQYRDSFIDVVRLE